MWLRLAVGLLLIILAAPTLADPLPQRGMYLLATPKVGHPMWRQTVILLLEHGPGGTLGVIVNRPLDVPAEELLPEVPGIRSRELRLYSGGPVARDGLLWLLRSRRLPDGAKQVMEGVSYGSDPTLLMERLLAGGNDSEIRLLLGHAGWAPGQLAGEIARGDWRVLPADADSLFTLDSERQWLELTGRRLQRWVRSRPGGDTSRG
jgi:putative transcriptional regulator